MIVSAPKQLKAFLGTTTHTKGPQGAVSSVVSHGEKRIFQSLKEISQHFPQFLEVFKINSLLALIVEYFFSEMRVRSYDMP